jgi:hypothetical protein
MAITGPLGTRPPVVRIPVGMVRPSSSRLLDPAGPPCAPPRAPSGSHLLPTPSLLPVPFPSPPRPLPRSLLSPPHPLSVPSPLPAPCPSPPPSPPVPSRVCALSRLGNLQARPGERQAGPGPTQSCPAPGGSGGPVDGQGGGGGMRLLFLAVLRPHTGNAVTAKRVR